MTRTLFGNNHFSPPLMAELFKTINDYFYQLIHVSQFNTLSMDVVHQNTDTISFFYQTNSKITENLRNFTDRIKKN